MRLPLAAAMPWAVTKPWTAPKPWATLGCANAMGCCDPMCCGCGDAMVSGDAPGCADALGCVDALWCVDAMVCGDAMRCFDAIGCVDAVGRAGAMGCPNPMGARARKRRGRGWEKPVAGPGSDGAGRKVARRPRLRWRGARSPPPCAQDLAAGGPTEQHRAQFLQAAQGGAPTLTRHPEVDRCRRREIGAEVVQNFAQQGRSGLGLGRCLSPQWPCHGTLL